MARDARLKVSTRKACSKKRRAWNKSVASKKVATSVAPPAVSPVGSMTEPCATTSTSVRSQPRLPPLECAGASSSAEHIDDNVPGPSSRAERVDTVFYTDEACAEREERAKRVKSSLADISATSRKFDLLDVSMASDDNDHGTEFIVVGMEVLRKFFCATTCTQCGTVGLQFAKCNERQYGLAVKLELTCSSCDFAERHFSSPRVGGPTAITPFEINLRAVKGIQSIGKGVTALADFCATLNLSHRGLHHKTFRGHMDTMVDACQAAASASEKASVEVVKTLYKDFLSPPGNIDVIFDGTWKTRGHKSNIGVGCIIELYTGLVLDHVVLSRYCRGCQRAPDPSDDSYGDWAVNHKCLKNIDCNAGRMEVEAALILFRRSLEKNGLRYTTILSDGDSRTFHALTEESVYGYIDIEKKDCLNHVHKRMGTALRTLQEKKKAQGESLGGKGRLTQDKIKKIAAYYGYALRSHTHDIPAMQKAVKAILLHMTSTDDAPDHSHCPEGASSWCSYNRALASNEKPPPHKNPLPASVRTALEPVFARLGDRALLHRCTDGMTQNAIECLHSVIWSQSSKNTHESLLAVERAVAEAVSRFNQGMVETSRAVAEQLGYSPGSCLIRRSLEKDRKRLYKANKGHTENEKLKRRMSKRHQPNASQDYCPGLL